MEETEVQLCTGLDYPTNGSEPPTLCPDKATTYRHGWKYELGKTSTVTADIPLCDKHAWDFDQHHAKEPR